MKHIPIKNKKGNIEINKYSLADIAELIRENPLACRILLSIASNADSDNSLITDIKTLSRMNNNKKEWVKDALLKLKNTGFLDIETVELNHKVNIYKYIHDEDLYYKTKEEVWKVLEVEFIDEWKINRKFNKFTVNDAVIKCNGMNKNKVLINIKDNLFFDTNVSDDEIIGKYRND